MNAVPNSQILQNTFVAEWPCSLSKGAAWLHLFDERLAASLCV